MTADVVITASQQPDVVAKRKRMPLIAFNVRMQQVIARREEWLLHHCGERTSSCDSAQARVGISDCSEQIAVSRQQLNSGIELSRIMRRQ